MNETLLLADSVQVQVWWTHGLGKDLLQSLLAAVACLGSTGSKPDRALPRQLLS